MSAQILGDKIHQKELNLSLNILLRQMFFIKTHAFTVFLIFQLITGDKLKSVLNLDAKKMMLKNWKRKLASKLMKKI